MYQHILVDITDGIATVTLNRPDKLNAYTVDMGEEIVEAFEQLRDEPDARVVILTGSGRGFCAGVDLEHLKDEAARADSDDSNRPRLGEERLVREFPLTLLDYPKPVIAAINGHAIGVGITMVLACDMRIAAESAKLGLPFTRMGILPGLGASYLLSQLVGPANARDLVLTARTVQAAEAMSMGLVNEVVPAATLQDRARAIASAVLESQGEALLEARALLNNRDRAEVAAAMQREREASARLRG